MTYLNQILRELICIFGECIVHIQKQIYVQNFFFQICTSVSFDGVNLSFPIQSNDDDKLYTTTLWSWFDTTTTVSPTYPRAWKVTLDVSICEEFYLSSPWNKIRNRIPQTSRKWGLIFFLLFLNCSVLFCKQFFCTSVNKGYEMCDNKVRT